MGDLVKGVDPSISPPGTNHTDRRVRILGDFINRVFQDLLYRSLVGLDLKAREVRPVVGKGNFITIHLLFLSNSQITKRRVSTATARANSSNRLTVSRRYQCSCR